MRIGYRTNAVDLDLADILPADVEAQVKEAAEISMGTEISEEDITNVRHLCDQVRLVESVNASGGATSSISGSNLTSVARARLIIYDDVRYRPSLNITICRSVPY